ncbi:MAG: hypothetical protein KC516_02900 [Nanoarchaeota archaeon]|nr:hypothetical protein [Nanoarchaeota archaeon]
MIIPSRRIGEIEEKIQKIDKLLVLAKITKNKQLSFLVLEKIEETLKDIIEIFPIKHEIFDKEEVQEIFELTRSHRQSEMEFLKEEEIIILSKEQEINKFSNQKLLDFIKMLKVLILKIKSF